jgi:hypothetical protein
MLTQKTTIYHIIMYIYILVFNYYISNNSSLLYKSFTHIYGSQDTIIRFKLILCELQSLGCRLSFVTIHQSLGCRLSFVTIHQSLGFLLEDISVASYKFGDQL